MADWASYQGEKGDKTFAVNLTVYVKAKTESEAWAFILSELKPVGGIGYNVQDTAEWEKEQ